MQRHLDLIKEKLFGNLVTISIQESDMARSPNRNKRIEDYLWVPQTLTKASRAKPKRIDRNELERAARDFRIFLEKEIANEARAPKDPEAFASHS